MLDVHLPPVLAAAIRAEGHQCDEVRSLIPPHSTDLEIVALANRLDAVVISKDIDFVDLVERGVLRTGLVRIRLLNMMAKETSAAILPRLGEIVEAIEAGERIVEVR